MNRESFDTWTMTLATRAGSRRSFTGLLAALATGLGPGPLSSETEARDRKRLGKRPRRDGRHPRRGVTKEIIGGQSVPDGTYPFITALLDITRGSTAYLQQFCGGALIDPGFVLTAAHCVEGFASDPRNLRVAVGRTRLNSSTGVVRSIRQILVHPSYDPSTARHDAALLELTEAVTTLSPIALSEPGNESLEQAGVRLKVIGWGDTVPQPNAGGDHDFPDQLQEVEVPVRPDQTCLDSLAGYDGSVMVCAGEANRDSCFGDSGGPLFGTLNGIRRLVGIVSFGAGCGSATPGAYTEINAQSIADFIAQRSPLPLPAPASAKQPPRKRAKKKRKHRKRRPHRR